MSYFSTIYSDNRLPVRAKTVYMYLRDRSDKEHKCWPGINTIAAELNCSRSTVKRALHDLEKHGYIRRLPRYRESGSRSSNLYVLVDDLPLNSLPRGNCTYILHPSPVHSEPP